MEDLTSDQVWCKKPLTSRFRKKYVELLALNILQYCYKDTYDGFDVYDAPDIRDENKLAGIEVTEAIDEKDAQIAAEFVKYRLDSKAEMKEQRKKRIENNGGRLEESILTYPEIDGDKEKQIIQNAIKKKMEKLKSYKNQGFKSMGLFIYYDGLPIPRRLDEFRECFKETLNEYDDKYDTIYLGYSCGLIEYEVFSNNIKVMSIERDIYNRILYETRLKMESKSILAVEGRRNPVFYY